MGYVSIMDEVGGFQLKAESGLRLYAAIALPLIVTTMGVYGAVELGKQRSFSKKTNNKDKDLV